MSWLARSIANSLKLDDDEADDLDQHQKTEAQNPSVSDDGDSEIDSSSSPSHAARGVKEDLSDLTKTLTRQLWGVASFLAPPPSSSPPKISSAASSSHSDLNQAESVDSTPIAGIRSDFAEIGGKFRTGISKLSGNMAVSEITKMASNFLQFGSDQDYVDDDYLVGEAIGVTNEVLTFARNIAMHPETWLDFPLEDEEDADDFELSDAQQEHALAVERRAPRLAALRIELCPAHMSEGCFWKIYFVLLQPRLNKHDAELLSTPQIAEARTKLTRELQSRSKTKPETDWLETGTSYSHSDAIPLETSVIERTSAVPADVETEKHPIQSSIIHVVDKSVINEGPSSQTKYEDDGEDDGDDWLKEENTEMGGLGGSTALPIENEEDVSFSDLEEDIDDGDAAASIKKDTYGSDSSAKDSRDWVQLSKSSANSTKDIHSVNVESSGAEKLNAKESGDWLNVDDIDVE